MERPPTPDWLMGRHFDTAKDISDAVDRLLAPSHQVYKRGGLDFPNAPEPKVVETLDPNYEVMVYVPLPHLHMSEYTLDEIEAMLGLCVPIATKIRVEVHPGDG